MMRAIVNLFDYIKHCQFHYISYTFPFWKSSLSFISVGEESTFVIENPVGCDSKKQIGSELN